MFYVPKCNISRNIDIAADINTNMGIFTLTYLIFLYFIIIIFFQWLSRKFVESILTIIILNVFSATAKPQNQCEDWLTWRHILSPKHTPTRWANSFSPYVCLNAWLNAWLLDLNLGGSNTSASMPLNQPNAQSNGEGWLTKWRISVLKVYKLLFILKL